MVHIKLLAYADDVNILGGSIHTLKENAEALIAATSEIGLEVSADKTKYMVMSRDQNAGRIQSVRIDNTVQQKIFFPLVPWILGLFLGLFGALIQKMTLDRPHQL